MSNKAVFCWLRKRSLFRWLKDQRGAIATEHATVLGMIAIGAVVTMGFVGQTMSHRFQDVANLMETDSPNLGGAGNGTAAEGDASAAQKSFTASLSWTLALILVAAPGCICLTLFLMHRRRTRELELPPVDPAQRAEAQARFIAKRQSILRALSNDIDALLDSQIEVRHVMTSHVRTVPPTAPVRDLAKQMNQLEFRHMLVCSSEGRLLGIVSDRDVRSSQGRTAASIMTRNPVTVASTSMLKPAMTVMLDRHISSLPVVDDGKLVGILTLTDLVMALQCTMQVLAPLAAELRAKLPAAGESHETDADRQTTVCNF